MRELGVVHDSFTLPIVNKVAFSIPNCTGFMEIFHSIAIRIGFASDTCFCNTVIDVCVKFGCFHYACKVFDEMPHRDLVSWTSVISWYACEGSVVSAFKLFEEMRIDLEPNMVTMIIMLQACATSGSVVGGRALHGYVVKKGMINEGSVQNSILTMYSKTSSAEDVETFFGEIDRKDVISWNVLISFYSLRGDNAMLSLRFNEMREDIRPSMQTLTSVISASADSGNLAEGKMLHCFVIKSGLQDSILQTSLLNCYSKCGELGLSTRLFEEMSCRNSITWCAMMSGFIQNGHFKESIKLFQRYQSAGFKLWAEILKSVIVACANLGALRLGKEIHSYIIRNLNCSSEEDTAALETSILNLYIKCGSINSARVFFYGMNTKDMVTWTSMIEGFGIHGLGSEAIQTFHRMVENGTPPNKVTFLSLLSACSHCGLVSQGREVFYSMKLKFGIEPGLHHYTCIVDLLGRRGHLIEAASVILKMVNFPDSRIWGALLASSRTYSNDKLGRYAASRILELEPDNTGYYVLLSNIQAGAENWAEVEQVRKVFNERELKKKPGWSCIEAAGGMCGFVSGDRSHPQMTDIYDVLGHLHRKIQDFGCVCVAQ